MTLDNRTDGQCATQYAAPPREEGRIIIKDIQKRKYISSLLYTLLDHIYARYKMVERLFSLSILAVYFEV